MATYQTSNRTSYGRFTIEITEGTSDITTNTSAITWALKYTSSGQYYCGVSTFTIVDSQGNTLASYSRSYGVVTNISQGTQTLKSGSTSATHNSDGTGTLTTTITYCIGNRTYYTETFTTTLTTIPRASEISLSASTLTLGTTGLTMTATSKANFYHDLTWSLNGSTTTVWTKRQINATSNSSTIGYTTLLGELSNVTSGTLTATLKTYSLSGSTYTQVGATQTATCSISVNTNTYKPSVTLGTISVNTKTSGNTLTALVAGYCTAKATVTATNSTGATSFSVVVTTSHGSMNAGSFTANGTATTNTLPSSSSNYTLTLTATITDSRGISATTTKTATVYGYVPPKITGSFYRVVSTTDTSKDEAGLYAYGTYSGVISSSVNNTNSMSSTSATYSGASSGSYSSGATPIALAENGTLTFTVTATDKVSSSTATFDVGTALIPLDLYDSGTSSTNRTIGAAIGGVAASNKFDVYLPTNLTKETTIKDIFKIDIKGSATNYDTDGYREVVVNVSTAELKEKDSTLTSSSGDSQWLTALLKVLVEKYPLGRSVLYRGKIYPNSYAFYSIFIYSTNELSSGLPRYAFGWWQHFYNFYQVGTNNYSVFIRGVSLLNYSNVSNGTTAATYRPALVPGLNGDGSLRASDNLYFEIGKASDKYVVFAIGKANIRGYLRLFDHNSSYYAQIRPIGGLTANHTYDLPDVNGTIALTSQLPTTGTASSVFTRTGGLSGSTCDYAHLKRYGNVVTIYAKFTCATQAGTSTSNRDIFTGTMNNSNYPPYDVEAFSYYGTSAIGLRITPQGAVTVRNASGGSVTISDSIYFSVTYVL